MSHEPSNAELKGLILGLGTQITAIERRVSNLERDEESTGKRLTDLEHRHDKMAGDLLREVGTIHKSLTHQDKELEKQTAQLTELIDDKKAIKAYAKAVGFTVIVAPGVWLFIEWAIAHVKL